MDHIKQLDSLTRFIRLQVSNQMPTNRIVAHLGNLFFSFLNFVLAKVDDSSRRRFAYHFRGMSFAHRHQRNLFKLSTDTKHSGFHSRADLRKAFCECTSRLYACTHWCKKIERQL